MNNLRKQSHVIINWIEHSILLIIAISTVIAMGIEIYSMVTEYHVSLADLLLMFIYLEVLAMVSAYLNSGKLPIRMPLYICIVAIARYMLLDMKNLDTVRFVSLAVVVLMLAVTVLIIRFGQTKYPSEKISDNLYK